MRNISPSNYKIKITAEQLLDYHALKKDEYINLCRTHPYLRPAFLLKKKLSELVELKIMVNKLLKINVKEPYSKEAERINVEKEMLK